MEILQTANDQLAIVLAERFLEDYKSQGERIGALKKAKRTKATDKFDPATAKVQHLPDVRRDEIPSRSPREIRFDTVERKLKNAGFERFDKGNDESVRKYKKDKNKDICVLMISELSRPQLVVDEVHCQGVDDAIARAEK